MASLISASFFFFFSFSFSFPFFFFLPLPVARGILVPRPGIDPGPLAVRARSPNHWTAREFPSASFYFFSLAHDPSWPPQSHFCVAFQLKHPPHLNCLDLFVSNSCPSLLLNDWSFLGLLFVSPRAEFSDFLSLFTLSLTELV